MRPAEWPSNTFRPWGRPGRPAAPRSRSRLRSARPARIASWWRRGNSRPARSRTTTTFSYNGVAFSVIDNIDNVNNGLIFGYLDDASLPTDGAAHDLISVLSGSVTQQVMGAVLYRGVTAGAPVDSETVSNDSTPALALTGLAAGSLAVAAIGSNVDTPR